MSTEGTIETTASADDFTPEERAYFETRGEAGLPTESGAAAQAPAEQLEAKAEDTGSDDDPDGTISIDENGMRRDRKTGRFVPHGAFHKEREARKSAETELAELRVREARVNERLAILSQAFEQQEAPATKPTTQPEGPPPDPEQDIFGYVKWLGERNKALEAQLTETRTTTERTVGDMEMATAYRNDAMAFARETADFGEAYNHLVKAIDAELALMGVADPKQRMAEIARLEREQVALARKAGRRPAQHIYELAKVRGWAPKPATAAPAEQVQPPSQPAPANDAAAAELARLERGQNAARSLSSAGGGAPAALTAEAIASMSEAEFSALLAKSGGNHNAALRKLLGG